MIVSMKSPGLLESIVLNRETTEALKKVGDSVRQALEELVREQVIDPSIIDTTVERSMENYRAILLLHKVCADPRLCLLLSIVPDTEPARQGRFVVQFSVPDWIVKRLKVLQEGEISRDFPDD